MSRVYDSWEKLVGAVLDREELRRLALCDSFSSISTDFSSRFSFDSNPEVCRSSGQHIEYEEIRKATRNFEPDLMLGEGSISYVYKGVIDENYLAAVKPGSRDLVAVKKMKHQGYEGLTEWVDKISHLRHPNLVTPIGYSSGTDQRIFVYEFMPKGSLDNHLFRKGPLQSLPWETRIRVAVGVARGLAFLHSLEIPVIYGVLKSGDILLDAYFNAKLSDVGLPKDLSRRRIEGPFGIINEVGAGYGPYAAPEYIATGHLYPRSDVYSFGVVVLVELMLGRRALDRIRAAGEHNLVDWAKPYLGSRRRLLQIMDTRLEGQYTHNEAYRVGQIALQCSNPTSRPRMAEVVAALEKL